MASNFYHYIPPPDYRDLDNDTGNHPGFVSCGTRIRRLEKNNVRCLILSLQEVKLAGTLVRLEIIIIIIGVVIGLMFLFALVMVSRHITEVKNGLKKIIELLKAMNK